MNYKKLYNALYRVGYHDKAKNHGVQYVDFIKMHYPLCRILEVGCSNGLAVHKLQKKHFNAYGIDISEIAIRYATEKFGVRNCIEGDILDIPFKDNYFDRLFSCDVIEHLTEKDVYKAIREITRVTSKTLFLKISPELEGNREFLTKIQKKFRGFHNVKNLHLTVWPLSKWIEVIETEGKCKFFKEYKGLLVFDL